MADQVEQAELVQSKAPSVFTLAKHKAMLEELPFDDVLDFSFATKGFIAKPEQLNITNNQGEVVWSLNDFSFLKKDNSTSSIHPSLERQAVLNMNYGLYKVTEGIYQVRGYDLANITYIKGNTGWIVFDPLTVPETAKAAHALLTKHLGDYPIKAVIYSHAHGDHFGGIKGIITQEQVDNGEVEVIAPRDFMEHVVKENVLAGNAMTRRVSYQYGGFLPINARSVVDGALGKGLPLGRVSLITPTRIIEKPLETIEIDGITLVMQNTPDTESPSEMNTWLPQFKTLWMAENVVAGLHNIYTIRGAQTRDAAGWSKYINKVLKQFGQKADIMIASHHWPRWGNDVITDMLEKQRDMYGYLHDQALHLANKGVTINEIHNELTVPKVLSQEWYNRGYHGSYSHNIRGVVNKYLGYFDMNPATLNKLSPVDAGKKYVSLVGGSEQLLAKAQIAFDKGEYRWVAELLNHLVFAEPKNIKARLLQANTFEQLGYQSETAGWRNAYLAGAFELRNGMAMKINTVQIGVDIVRAMDTELVLDYFGVRLNAERAKGKEVTINLILPDQDNQFLIELKNSHLNNLANEQAKNADLTMTINKEDFDNLLLKITSIDELIQTKKLTYQGDLTAFAELISLLDDFDYWFEIVQP
jgi:alkyl sulfatase BDS1-like metallo-beta-lactamase superfamily hydrolase